MNRRTTNNAENIHYSLIKGIVIGVLLMLGAFWFWWHLAGNPFEEFALIRSAQTVSGFIIDTWEEPGETDYGETRWSHSVTYKYCVPSGREFMGNSKGRGRLSQELSDLTEPYPVEIEYLPNKPKVSRIKGGGCQSITEWLWRKIGIGGILLVVFLSIGFSIIQNAINEFKRSKMLSGNMTEENNSPMCTE